MFNKQLLTAFGFVWFVALAAINGNAYASTPDGETPANEGVCDALQGATPGLYGLCVAYCEAQDLDSFEKNPPSEKILANYRKKMNDGDPDMPCVQVACPCWTADELASVSAEGDASCNDSTTRPRISNTGVLVPNLTHFAEVDITASRERCRYIDLNTDPRTIRSFITTPEEAQSCFDQVVQACGAL